MTLRFLDPAFDVIFVVAHDNKAGVAELFEMRKRRVSNIRSSWFSLRAERFFGCSMILLKLTVKQVSSARLSNLRKQSVPVIRQN
jgi:hypothetical protein